MSMRVTIKDVAREAGVAISTVSKVLNGADNLRPGTRHAVEAAIRGLNYIPNANARSLKSRRKDAIGLFLSSIQGEFYTGMAQAIHTECMVAGFTLEIYVSGGTGSDGSGVDGAHALFECEIDRETGEYLSEDFGFCRRWLAIGGTLWLDTLGSLSHTGPIDRSITSRGRRPRAAPPASRSQMPAPKSAPPKMA